MPQRALNIALAILGLAAVAALAVAGADAWAHARRGPRWWRRIVGAGLAFTAMLGLGSCNRPPFVSCYKPATLPPAEETVLTLRERAGVLDEFAAAETLDREATLIVLETIEDKLAILSDEAALAELSPEARAKAIALRDEVRAKIEKIRKKLGPPPESKGDPEPQTLEATDEWQRVDKVWREAEEIASGKRGDYPFDEAGKKRVLDSLGAAARDVDVLMKRGLLSAPEAGLLAAELGTLSEGVRMKRPTEMRNASCYEPMMIIPARESLERLKARLPLLETLAAKGVVRNEVVRRVVARAAEDARALLGKDGLSRLSDAERAEAKELAEAMLRLEKALALPPRPTCYSPPVLRNGLPGGKPDASVIRRRMDVLAALADGHALSEDAAVVALRSAEADLEALEGGRT